MFLPFNATSGFVCHSFSSNEQASFNFMAAVTVHSVSEPNKIKSATVFIFSSPICYEVMELDATISVLLRRLKKKIYIASFSLEGLNYLGHSCWMQAAFRASLAEASKHVMKNYTWIPHFIVLYCVFQMLLILFYFLMDSLWQPCIEQLLVPFFQQHLLTQCLCITFW